MSCCCAFACGGSGLLGGSSGLLGGGSSLLGGSGRLLGGGRRLFGGGRRLLRGGRLLGRSSLLGRNVTVVKKKIHSAKLLFTVNHRFIDIPNGSMWVAHTFQSAQITTCNACV